MDGSGSGQTRELRQRRRRTLFVALASALPAVFLASCKTTPNPVTGRPQVVFMTPEDERRIDEEQSAMLEAQEGLVPDEKLQQYVAELGAMLAKHSPRQDVEYHFAVLATPLPNAMALPGGHIYVTRGLIELSNSEAELANVIGHEIGHVAARHLAQRDAHQKTMGLATWWGNIASGGGEDDGRKVYEGIYGYSRGQESEADRIGQDIAVAAGVDPLGMSRFMRQLDATTRLEQGFSTPESYYATHPSTPQRVAESITSAQRRSWTPSPGIAPRPLDYLRKLDGLEIGQSPSEGLMVNGRFVHPDLRFSVRPPRGWRLQNAHTHVGAFSPDRNAVVLLQLAGDGDDAEAGAREDAKRLGFSLSKQARVQIGDLSAFRAEVGRLPSPYGPIRAEVTWIAFRGLIYRLSGGVPRGRFGPHEAAFRTFARSFREVEPEEVENLAELRLRIAVARDGESLAELSRRTRNQWSLGRTAVFNGLHVDSRLERGQLVKVASLEPYVPKSEDEAKAAAREQSARGAKREGGPEGQDGESDEKQRGSRETGQRELGVPPGGGLPLAPHAFADRAPDPRAAEPRSEW